MKVEIPTGFAVDSRSLTLEIVKMSSVNVGGDEEEKSATTRPIISPASFPGRFSLIFTVVVLAAAARKRKTTEITAVHFTLRMCGTRRYEQLEMTRSWRIYYWRGITLGITLVSFEKIEEENLKQRRKRKRWRRVALRVKRKRFS